MSWEVPAVWAAGTRVRYNCTINGHGLGETVDLVGLERKTYEELCLLAGNPETSLEDLLSMAVLWRDSYFQWAEINRRKWASGDFREEQAFLTAHPGFLPLEFGLPHQLIWHTSSDERVLRALMGVPETALREPLALQPAASADLLRDLFHQDPMGRYGLGPWIASNPNTPADLLEEIDAVIRDMLSGNISVEQVAEELVEAGLLDEEEAEDACEWDDLGRFGIPNLDDGEERAWLACEELERIALHENAQEAISHRQNPLLEAGPGEPLLPLHGARWEDLSTDSATTVYLCDAGRGRCFVIYQDARGTHGEFRGYEWAKVALPADEVRAAAAEGPLYRNLQFASNVLEDKGGFGSPLGAYHHLAYRFVPDVGEAVLVVYRDAVSGEECRISGKVTAVEKGFPPEVEELECDEVDPCYERALSLTVGTTRIPVEQVVGWAAYS